MGLGKRKQTSIVPRLKYDGRAGKFSLISRVQENNEWFNDQVDIAPGDFRAVVDLDNLEIGWIHYPEGGAPDIKLVKVGQEIGDPPGDKHKEGIRLLLLMDDQLSGDVRELMSTAGGLWNGLDTLHDAYMVDRDKNPGKLPVVVLSGTLDTGSATNPSHEPIFSISEWVSRPTELPLEGIPVSQPAKKKPALATASSKSVKRDMDDEIPF
jgi:hypothetical protein